MLNLPVKNPETIRKFLSENNELLLKLIVTQIAAALKTGRRKVNLFSFGGSSDGMFIASIEWQDFENSLNSALKHFISTEQYEYAAKCRKVLDRFKIEEITS